MVGIKGAGSILARKLRKKMPVTRRRRPIFDLND
jgi:hypothetical protein